MPVWRNWAGDQVCAPARIEQPSSEPELIAAVRRAADDGLPVRVAGAGHSFTDAACTDGAMISLDRMKSIVDVDRASGLVEVQAGIRLHDLGERLAEHGLAMENLGDIAVQALAGAISTATHGTGLRFPNLSAQVHALRIVTASGDVVTASADGDADLFRAARVAIGALGAISTVTLRCVPTYTLRRVDEPRPLEETLDALPQIVEAHEHWEFFTFPYTGIAFTRLSERTDEPARPASKAVRVLKDVVAENLVLGAICRAGTLAPSAVPRLNRTLPKLASREERVDRSDRVFANDRLVRFTEMEYAIPREHAAEAVRRILGLVESRNLPITFPLEVRFAPPDDAFIGPSFGRESCYIAVHVYAGTPFESYFRGVEEIMSSYGGRPHWGKRHYLSEPQLRERYPEWDSFQAVRERLDPEGVFANSYTRRVLGAPASVGGQRKVLPSPR
jgi:L-gulono-1,4-lactone dehydrogenase